MKETIRGIHPLGSRLNAWDTLCVNSALVLFGSPHAGMIQQMEGHPRLYIRISSCNESSPALQTGVAPSGRAYDDHGKCHFDVPYIRRA